MTKFARAAARHARAVNVAAGERLRLKPQRKGGLGGGTGGDDASRPAVEFLGTVVRRSMILQMSGQGAKGATNARLVDAYWAIGWPAELLHGARDGDHVERLDPPAGEPAVFRLFAPLSIRGRTIHPADPV